MLLLAPSVTSPISECNKSVEVRGMVTGATVQLFVTGNPNPIGQAVATWSKQVIPFNPGVTLAAGSSVTALQKQGAVASPQSSPVKVQKKPSAPGVVSFNG